MSDWATRKKERTEHYDKYVKGWKEVDCCDGTGKEKISPLEYNKLEKK